MSDSIPTAPTAPAIASPVEHSSAKNEDKKKRSYAEQDRKKKQENRKLGKSFCEDDIVVENGLVASIGNRSIENVSLESLKSFARKLGLKVKNNTSKLAMCMVLAKYKTGYKTNDESTKVSGNVLPSKLERELGDYSTTRTCNNVAHARLPDEVFLTSSDSSYSCTKNHKNNDKQDNKTRRSKLVADTQLKRDNAIIDKNVASKKFLEEVQLSMKRKRYNEVLDVLMDVEDKLYEEERKLREGLPGARRRRIDILRRKLDNLVAEEEYIKTFLSTNSK